MGTLSDIFNMSPNQAANLQNFGFSTMAASQQPGITTMAALGQGGLGMNQAAQQRAQTQNIQQEGVSKKLNNAVALRGLNIGNAAMGLQPVTMQGVPDLLNQQPAQPSGANAGMSWSQTSGGGAPEPSTRHAPAKNPVLDNLNVSQDVLDVALQKRAPANRDEAVAAARVASFLGYTDWSKSLSSTAMKGLEPWESKPGGVRGDPLAGTTTVNPAHIQNVEGNTVPFAPQPIVYGNGKKPGDNRNAGQGVGGAMNTIPPIPSMEQAPQMQGNGKLPAPPPPQGIKTGWSPTEKTTQKNYLEKETEAYNGAQGAMQNLELMQHSIDTLNSKPGFFSTGSAGKSRIAWGKLANTFLAGMGASLLAEDKIAAGESLFKTTGRLGFNMSKQLGSREPGVITQQAIDLNPGMDNTPRGIQLLKNSVQEEQQRIIDEHNFKGQFYQERGWNQQKAEAAFDQQYKPELYAKRATSQLDPIAIPNTVANDPVRSKKFVSGFLAGTHIKTPKGIKIIPPGMGVTPPSYQSVLEPFQPQNPPEQEAE